MAPQPFHPIPYAVCAIFVSPSVFGGPPLLAVGIEVCIPVHRWLYACSPNEIETSSLHDLDRIVGRIIPIPGACVLPDVGHRDNNPVVV